MKSQFEQHLETDVLAKYNLPSGQIIWHSHDNVGPDDVVHYFTIGNQKYALVWNEFPNETFIHEEQLTPVLVNGGADEWLHLQTGELAGYYSLYEDN